jgi:hypothetical protein
MRTTSAERMTLHRQRKKLGMRPVPVILSEREIDYLVANNYDLSRRDPRSIGQAVAQFLSDSALFTPGRSCR